MKITSCFSVARCLSKVGKDMCVLHYFLVKTKLSDWLKAVELAYIADEYVVSGI